MKPLNTLDELINWTPLDSFIDRPLDFLKRKYQKICGTICDDEEKLSRKNKVLLCHDMQGGYLDDCLREKNENVYAYRFYHWHLIDLFVYFSHHFITIPPVGWIYHSHRNGVQCLGTFIIEPGEHEKNFNLFTSETFYLVAQKLSEIKAFYNFDGWLVNLECSAAKGTENITIDNILSFLDRLVELGNEVYWYDAITTSGKVKWQNGLTKFNKPFYDRCGNIFLNYCWNQSDLELSMRNANGDLHNIFVGIDCFGRGCFGGGGFNCNLAFDVLESIYEKNKSIVNSKFSVALFAPGWCFESAPVSQTQTIDDNTWLFFNRIERYLYPWVDGHTLYRQLPEINIDKGYSFSTNFNTGQGFRKYLNGKIVFEEDYNFLLDQDWIPSGTISNHNSNIPIKILPDRNNSFNGHSCMTIIFDSANREGDLFQYIYIELFRIGCYINRNDDTSLSLVLGLDNVYDPDIWRSVYLLVTYDDCHQGITNTEFALDHIKINTFTSDINNIQWNTFNVKDLSTAFRISRSAFVVRKIDIKVANNLLMSGTKIYLGGLKLSCTNRL